MFFPNAETVIRAVDLFWFVRCWNQRLPLRAAEGKSSTYSTILSPCFLFLFCLHSADVLCKSPILVGNLACTVSPVNLPRTKWRARGQAARLLLIKLFDQRLFNSAHVVLWAPPVCSVKAASTSCTVLQPVWVPSDVSIHLLELHFSCSLR